MAISTQLQQLLRTLLPDKGFKTAGHHRDAIIAGVEESKTYTDEKSAEAIKKEGDQTIQGILTLEQSPVVPDATMPQHPMTLNQGIVKTQIKQTTGTSESDLMSQKAVMDAIDETKMVTDARVSSLENTLNSANINQETTATVTGVDTIALPKTAANTGMQVQLFGQSAQNLVVNGDFRNGMTEWSTIGSPLVTIADNIATVEPNVSGSGIAKSMNFKIDNTYYFRVVVKGIMNFRLRVGPGGTVEYQTSNRTYPDWSTFTYQKKIVNNGIYLFLIGDTGMQFQLQKVQVIDLTATFGAGNEPTKEQCDILFANYFEGSDNVLGTGRVRSVGADGENASILQLTTPPLRSNGLIKDEIRKGTNGHELVKRVGVGTLEANAINGGDFEGGLIGAKIDDSGGVSTWILNTTNPISGSQDGRLIITTTSSQSSRPMISIGLSRSKGQLRKISFSYKVNSGNCVLTSYHKGSTLATDNLTLTGTGIFSKYYMCDGPAILYLYFNGRNLFDLQIDNIKDELINTSDGLTTSASVTEISSDIHYTLTTPIITPIAHAGLLNSNANGTVYFEPIIADAGVYSTNLAVQLTDYPIASFELIRKYANGTYTELSITTAVIDGDGLSFTHPDLTSGDLVMFTYAYNKESIGRSMTLTHYDSRFVEADTVNGKVYRIVPVVTNGVVSWTTVEV